MCDVIVLTANCRPSVISVLSNNCHKAAAEQYSVTLACLLKRLCLLIYRHWCDRSTHLCFQRQLYYIGSRFELDDDKVYYPEEYVRPTKGTLDIVRCTLAAVLLHCEPMIDRFGDVTVRHLSSIQAKILLEKGSKITVIEGKAGSGKSVLALEAIRRIKQHNKDQSQILFLCRSRGLAAFAKYQTEKMGICVDIRTVQLDMVKDVKEDFSQYTDVFIDDAHALPLTGQPNCQDMYHSLFASLWKPKCHAYILLDPDMQDYRGCIPTNFTKEIQQIARTYHFIRRQDVKTEPLGKILRNSSRICQFIETNLEDGNDDLRNIRNLPEDGAYLYIIEDLNKTKEFLLQHKRRLKHGDYYRMHIAPFSRGDIINALQREMHDGDFDAAALETLKILKLLLRAALKGSVYEEHEEGDDSDDIDHDESERFGVSATKNLQKETLTSRVKDILNGTVYQERHIAILTQNTNEKIWIKEILECSNYQMQEAINFPVKHIVVDTLENFEGLDSPVILFIIPESWGTGYVGSVKYRLCIATRAISRLEFLIPWDPTGREQALIDLRKAFQRKVNCML